MMPPRHGKQDRQRCCRVCIPLLAPHQQYLAAQLARAAQHPVYDPSSSTSWRALLSPPLSKRLQTDVFNAVLMLREFAALNTSALAPDRCISPRMLSSCAGIATLSMMRVGAGWSCAVGTGLVVKRNRVAGQWGPPCAIAACGLGVGWQMGAEVSRIILVLPNDAAVQAFTRNSLCMAARLTLVAGLVGREASVTLQAGPGGRAACWSYSCARGRFAGAALESVAVVVRRAVNRSFYGYPIAARELLGGWVQPPVACSHLYAALEALLPPSNNNTNLRRDIEPPPAPAASNRPDSDTGPAVVAHVAEPSMYPEVFGSGL